MTSISFDLRILRALLQVASTDYTREYLNGIQVECMGDSAICVATDGHVLLAARVDCTCDVALSFIIPRTLISQIKLKATKPQIGTVTRDGDRVTIEFDGQTYGGPVAAGSYPDWRRVIPQSADNTAASYDPAVVQLLVAAAKAIGNKSTEVMIAQNGNGPGIVTIGYIEGAGIIGCIMPLRSQPQFTAPRWCYEYC